MLFSHNAHYELSQVDDRVLYGLIANAPCRSGTDWNS
jgi:hypothetical protein